MDISFVRSQFPALESDFIYMDNAGGSQILGTVIEEIQDHLVNRNVQLGASYEVSSNAGKWLEQTHQDIVQFINAGSSKEIVIGPSTTMLLRILSLCISKQWSKGDEIIVTNSDHEANVSCWTDLEEKGYVIKIWKINPETFEFDIKDLELLLSNKTRLVAMVHTSNILGTINPIKQIAKVVHDAGALFCIDGVAYAPHRKVDVTDLDVDFYTFSWYKVYGPHLAVMWGKYELLRQLDSINHYFIGKEEVPYKLQPGNFNFELTAGLNGIFHYFNKLGHLDEYTPSDDLYDSAFSSIAIYEESLSERMMEFLKNKPNVHIIGHKGHDKNKRVPTFSFVHHQLDSKSIVDQVDPHKIGIRYGDFYAKKLIHDLGLSPKNGVVRISLVHYNTHEELTKLCTVLDSII